MITYCQVWIPIKNHANDRKMFTKRMINDVIEARVISLFVIGCSSNDRPIVHVHYEEFKGSCKAVTAVSYGQGDKCRTFVLILYEPTVI